MTAAPSPICRYCRTAIDPAARRCPHCTSWLGHRGLTGAGSWLYVIGVLWIIVSVLSGAVLAWSALTSLGDLAQGLAVAVAIIGQGLIVGCAAMVIAERGKADPDPFR